MKKFRTFPAVLFCLSLSFISKAQDWSGKNYQFGEIYPGHIITLQGDTLTGYLVHNGRSTNQKWVKYYTDASKKEGREYKPKELKGYRVGDKEYRSISFSGGLMAKPLSFVLVTKPGRITQFTYYSKKDEALVYVRGGRETEAEFDARIHTDELVWKKGDESPIQQQDFVLGFAKKMSKLVSENVELAKKVEDKEKGYGFTNIYNIVEEYNKWWDATKR
jgi:hypothetical protein